MSTSLCHSLLLTTFGTVYSCGDSSDGQLGHGNLSGCKNFQVIDWFLQRNIIVSNVSQHSFFPASIVAFLCIVSHRVFLFFVDFSWCRSS